MGEVGWFGGCQGARATLRACKDPSVRAPRRGPPSGLLSSKGTVLTALGLEHIATHKYKPGAYTPLDNVLNPMWVRLTEYLPLWLAPNAVTLLGLMVVALSYVSGWWFSPDCATPPPRGQLLFTALALFLYQTLDAMDGKQARRVGASSPLGQLFDHGCDCLASLAHHSMASVVLLPGAGGTTLAGLAMLMTCFFMAQWQEYYTGVLHAACGPVGTTEVQLALIITAILAGLAGPETVRAFVASPVQVPWNGGPEAGGAVGCQVWVLVGLPMVVACLANTLNQLRKERPRLLRSVVDLLPIVLLNLLLFTWDSATVARKPRLLCLATGLLFFYYTMQMILFSMARMPFPAVQYTLIPFGALAMLSRLAPGQAALLDAGLQMFVVLTSAFLILWVVTVVEELKKKLNIHMFSLGPLSKKVA